MSSSSSSSSGSSGSRRRAAVRRKPVRFLAEKKAVRGPAWLNEALACALCGAALLLTISLIHHISSPTASASAHPFGLVGEVTSRHLYNGFGCAAFALSAYLLGLGIYFWRHEVELARRPWAEYARFFGTRGLGIVAGLVGVAVVFSIFPTNLGGGRVGDAIALPIRRLINPTGTVCLATIGVLLAMSLATGRSVQSVLKSMGAGIAWVFLSLPPLLWFGFSAAVGASYRFLRSLLWFEGDDILLSRPARDVDEEESEGASENNTGIPRPRLRRNKLPEVTEEHSDKDTEDYSHIVVMRRDKELRTERRKLSLVTQPPAETDYEGAFPDYERPDLGLLIKGEPPSGGEDDEELRQMSRQIELKLRDFDIAGRVTQVHPGPVITLFEFDPAPGVKVSKIAGLHEDLSMSLRASSLRIVAPIPKRGTVGIEVPNRKRDTVRLRDVLESEVFVTSESLLTVGLGKDTYGEPVAVDLASMPHLLIAGSTGTGKSVCINSILLSLLCRAHPSELGLILIDPKVLELSTYEDIPHLRVPVVTVAKQARAVLSWAVQEMERRYRMMQRFAVRNIDGYNAIVRGEQIKSQAHVEPPEEGESGVLRAQEGAGGVATPIELDVTEAPPIAPEKLKPLPKIVIVIDELADLMLTVGREVEELITRLAAKARASGIHLIIATQRPSVDVITGLIKANFPARLSFRVAQRVDSRTILDSMGAEKLLGKGDMLFMLPGGESLRRIHGAFVTDAEVKNVVDAIKATAKPRYDERIMQLCQKALEEGELSDGPVQIGEHGELLSEGQHDSMYDRAVELVMEKGQASTSMIQRTFRIGYNRAARIIEMMEKEGVIGPADGARPREVLVNSGEGGSV